MGKLVLLLLIAHLIADYPLQTNNMKKNTKGLFLHIGVHFVVNCIFFITYLLLTNKSLEEFLVVAFCVFNIIFIHLLVDYFKEFLCKKIEGKFDVYWDSILKMCLYVLDQIIHFVVIITTFMVLFKEKYHISDKIMSLITFEKGFNLDFSTQLLITIIIILINIYFVGYLIVIILSPFKPKNLVREKIMEVPFENDELGKINHTHFRNYNVNSLLDLKVAEIKKIKVQEKLTFVEDSPAKSGMWIGILERTLIVILCMINSISSIAFVIAMKALTRFKQFDDKSFAEYYLIGNMLSISFAIINGYLVRLIW